MPDTPILTTPAELEALAAELARHSAIAVDLEADSMHHYREQVCLVQISTPSRTVLVDPLAVRDLSPLRPVLADPAVRKYFHAADYDIRCLHRDFAIEIRGLFDTMVACQFLGEEKVGLADVLQKYFDVSLDKRFQRADWSKRPLSGEMIRYAAEDTRHLHSLGEWLEGRLAAKGRLGWVAEEFALLEAVRHSESEGPLYLRFKGAGQLAPRQLAILDALLGFRDEEARRRDCPPFKVLGNAVLLELARQAPQSLRAMVGLQGMPTRLVERYGSRLLKLIAAAAELPEEQLPVFPRGERPVRDPEAEQRLERLKKWRAAKAAELGLEAGILINNAALENLSRTPPGSLQELAQSGLKNWQKEALGADICAVLLAPQ
ncbi:ribonuclease D [Geoalkalibacter halelectricus]|uniref:HRDC domain-containing protein n=1 Tax=Geoalkalibacter halelectricus TaxID=2847045 RepID=A0ABY5ZFL9_9BACT|nr:HRDC domain-containing protein [Geoalkalibacter halelectricus]MDO3378124.1 HRDC domain-containing protein [Geoalkalibacter halelectricus]UWZ77970.1 HRDC domain-containing protein [Geoalkalibacter halelectricus]